MTGNKIFMIFVMTFLLIPMSLPLKAQEERAKALISEERQKRDEAIASLEALLLTYPKGELVPNTLFQLGQLYMKKELDRHLMDMEEYDKQLALFMEGVISQEPPKPKMQYVKAIEYFKRLINEYPDFKKIDSAIYGLAYCLNENGMNSNNESLMEEASEMLENLIIKYPNSIHIGDSHFQLGEIYFTLRRYAEAIEHYKEILKDPNSQYYDTALYKIAWSHLKMLEYSEASEFFIKVTDRCEYGLTGGFKGFCNEAIPQIGRCYAEFSDYLGLRELFNKIGTRSYEYDVFYSYGKTQLDKNEPDEAIKAFKYLLQKQPNHRKSPEVTNFVIDALIQLGKEEEAHHERQQFHITYGTNSIWNVKNSEDPDLIRAVHSWAEDNLYRAATYWHQKAQKTNDKRYYENAIEAYTQYLENFRDYPERWQDCRYYKAEALFDINEWDRSIEVYREIVQDPAAEKYRHDASYAIVIGYARKMEKEEAITKRPENELTPTKEKLLASIDEFSRLFPESPKAPEALYIAGKLNANLERYYEAERLLKTITEFHKNHELYQDAAKLLAKVEFKLEKFEAAETALKTGGITGVEVGELMGLTIFKQAEMYEQKGLYEKAAENYERAQREKPKATVAPGALFKAMINWERVEKWDKVIEVGLKLSVDYSTDTLAPLGYWHAGEAYEKLENPNEAANVFETLAERFPDKKEAPAALVRAGVNREKAKEFFRAVTDYRTAFEKYGKEDFLKKFEGDSRKVIEDVLKLGLYNLGNAYEMMDSLAAAVEAYQNFINLYRDLDNVSVVLAYKAQGDIHFKDKSYEDAITSYQNAVSTFKILKEEDKEKCVLEAGKSQLGIGKCYLKKFEDYPGKNNYLVLGGITTEEENLINNAILNFTEAAKFAIKDITTEAIYYNGEAYKMLGDYFLSKDTYNPGVAQSEPDAMPLLPVEIVMEKIYNVSDVIEIYKLMFESHKSNLGYAKGDESDPEWIAKSREEIVNIVKTIEKLLDYEKALEKTPTQAVSISEDLATRIKMREQYPEFYKIVIDFIDYVLTGLEDVSVPEKTLADLKNSYSHAYFNRGKVMENIADMLLNAPIPAELTSEDEIKTYKKALSEEAERYRIWAAERYDGAITANLDKDITENEWISKTLRRLNDINPELYEETSRFYNEYLQGKREAAEERRRLQEEREKQRLAEEQEREIAKVIEKASKKKKFLGCI